MPKKITHELRLLEFDGILKTFLNEISGLGSKLGCILVQLPPSLRFDADIGYHFFNSLRKRTSVPIAFEPRHASWFTDEVSRLLDELQVARVVAHPPPAPEAAIPGGWRELTYYRLHGSPEIYYSTYSEQFISKIAARIDADLSNGRTVWCIFDNTALGAATRNALELLTKVEDLHVASH